MPTPLYRNISYLRKNYENIGITIKYRDTFEKITVLLSVLILIFIGSFIVFGKYTRRVKVSGLVTPSEGVIRVFAPREGRVIETSVEEGKIIHKGQPLYTISSESVTKLGETQANISRNLNLQRKEIEEEIKRRIFQDKITKAGLLDLKESLLKETNQIYRQISIAERKSNILKSLSEEFDHLLDRKLVQRTEAIQHLRDALQANQELESLQKQIIQNTKNLSEVSSKIVSFDSQSESSISTLRKQLLNIDRELIESEVQRRIQVVSPIDGTATAMLVKTGQLVKGGTSLVSILPASSRMEIHLFGGSNIIGFIHEGAKVLLRYKAFPYQKFGLYPGTVSGFSRVTLRVGDVFATGMEQIPSSSEGNGLYRITVSPKNEKIMAYGSAEPLRAGMEVDADIFLDTRYLYEWFFEPLYSLKVDHFDSRDRT
ncbi:secretion protein HlyD family protein [Liberibacter crescens BT-1]|uniref:Secretion protein HlyD family protein n=1 Tax=Liberibacter crescens (strain BT-1) TaxID=1215343 RepID=L0EWH8_LIBCB|nr:HlyD family efflux transporter periplasmic adaptor subunit [Liberibacter crescens]AGA65205.1 secretion protein HlyD family protein [Liberibacter crescens BT-1]AMC13158.1 hypothetical protein RL73_06140 [Liberibacter crescens]